MTVSFWLVAFLLTLLVECPVTTWALWPTRVGMRRLVGLGFFANLATHPAVWFVFPNVLGSYWSSVVVSELWAFLGEALFWALVLPQIGWRRALATSLCSNLLSFGLGWLLMPVAAKLVGVAWGLG